VIFSLVNEITDLGDGMATKLAKYSDPEMQESACAVLICFLGSFRLLRVGRPVAFKSGGKVEALLCYLTLRRGQYVPREQVLDALWPETDASLAAQSLSTLVYTLHKALGPEPPGAEVVLHEGGSYCLSRTGDVGLDVDCFDALADEGDRCARLGELERAREPYNRALPWYRGDLCVGTDIYAVIERERLRARYLTVLARLGDYYFEQGDFTTCLTYALRLLANDPCREDAHRMVMRCYVRRGERSQALRQYRLCEQALRAEFDAPPEPVSTALFDQIRLTPWTI
jgi:DNA-binding SARP family transcriptional activator